MGTMQSANTGPGAPGRAARLVILASGRGSNLQAIAESLREEHWNAEIVAVIAHREGIGALERARALGLTARVLALEPGRSREQQDAALSEALEALAPDWVVLAGYMRILSAGFVTSFAGRLVNIHPSLLPAFPGLHTHRQALQAGVKLHGATVHLVTAQLDTGPILGQAAVEVLADDTEESLAARVLEQEHRLYPRVLKALIDGSLVVQGCRSRWRDTSVRADPLLMLPQAA